jgi:hypothetical protein
MAIDACSEATQTGRVAVAVLGWIGLLGLELSRELCSENWDGECGTRTLNLLKLRFY